MNHPRLNGPAICALSAALLGPVPSALAHDPDAAEDAPVTWHANGWAGLEVASPTVGAGGLQLDQKALQGFALTESVGPQVPLASVTLDVGTRAGVGAVVSLMHGQALPLMAGPDFAHGLGPIRQAYVHLVLPGEVGMVDVGKFDTPFGAEVMDAAANFNQTRGALWFYAQPFFHTGARFSTALLPHVALKALLVNGWNNTVDNNPFPTVGLQVAWQVTETLSITVGELSGPEQAESASGAWRSGKSVRLLPSRLGAVPVRNMLDTIVTWDVAPGARLVVNGTAVHESEPARVLSNPTTWAGVAAMGQLLPVQWLALGARAEVIRDPQGVLVATGKDASILTSTFTADVIPHAWLHLRLEGRANTFCQARCSPEHLQAGLMAATVLTPGF